MIHSRPLSSVVRTAMLAGLGGLCLLAAPGSVSAAETAPPAAAAAEVKHVKVEGAAKLLAERKDVVVLDIRTPDEFAEGHLKGAVNIDYFADDFGKQIARLDKSKTYLVHCASGGRSTESLSQFKALKFTHLYHLDGGFKAWQKAGQPVAK